MTDQAKPPAPEMDRQIRLSDGRRLAYAEYGAAGGEPAFFFHGTPGSRLLRHPDPSIALELGVRLIVPDRPGMGRSDDKPGFTILDWPEDVAALADSLGLERFAVAGFSGGGPFAAACAYALPQRVSAVAIISGVGPLNAPGALEGMLPSNRLGYAVGSWMPWFLWRLIFALYYRDVRGPPQGRHPETLARMSEEEPESDHVIFETSGLREILVETFAEAFRQGTLGAAREAWLLSRPWGFPLEEITVPAFLWQGEADVVVTPAMGRFLAGKIPNCTARFLPEEGHLLFVTHWDEILCELITER
jgi:pimeloyl-ACP methyl ester carboxylesterase